MKDHTRQARFADDADFAALWMQGVPFHDPDSGETGQMLDSFTFVHLVSWPPDRHARRIALGTAGIVLPLRDPLIIAKQAVSVDQRTSGRLILGMSRGNRPVGWPAFGVDFGNPAEHFRGAFDLVRTTIEEAQGISHVGLNLKPSRRPVEEILQELAKFVLPHFPSE